MTSSVNSTNASYNFSVESFVRNQVANWCGPTKPVKPTKLAEEADQKARDAYEKAYENFEKTKREFPHKLEVFVYNTTANIANGAVVAAVVTAALAIFTSVIGPFFAFVVIGASALIHWDARNSLPAFVFEKDRKGVLTVYIQQKQAQQEVAELEEGGRRLGLGNTFAAVGKLTDGVVETKFGLPSANFESSDKTQWKPVAFAAASTPIWFNTLPTAKPAQKNEQQNETQTQEELEASEPPSNNRGRGYFNFGNNLNFGNTDKK